MDDVIGASAATTASLTPFEAWMKAYIDEYGAKQTRALMGLMFMFVNIRDDVESGSAAAAFYDLAAACGIEFADFEALMQQLHDAAHDRGDDSAASGHKVKEMLIARVAMEEDENGFG